MKDHISSLDIKYISRLSFRGWKISANIILSGFVFFFHLENKFCSFLMYNSAHGKFNQNLRNSETS